MENVKRVRKVREGRFKKEEGWEGGGRKGFIKNPLFFSVPATPQSEKRTITKAAVARKAGVSLVFLRSHSDLVQAIEEAARPRSTSALPAVPGSSAKDRVIVAMRRRLDEMKQQLAAKDRELHGK